MNIRTTLITPSLFALALTGTMFCTSHALAASPFTYAAYGPSLFDGLFAEDQSTSSTASVLGTDGQRARASFGDNGVALSDGGYAVSAWSDGWVVNGGSGASTLNFSVQLHGTIFDGDAVYALLMSDDPDAFSPAAIVAEATNGYVEIPDTTLALHVVVVDSLGFYDYPPESHNLPYGSVNSLFNVSVPFTYGQTFYVASVLDITGHGDFYNSAVFGVTAPEGASITSLSGTLYPAAAVPEAETYAMMLAGLGLIGFVVRRRAA